MDKQMQEIADLVRETFGLEADREVAPYTSSKTLPEWDSFGQIALLQALEAEYRTTFGFEEITRMESVAGIYDTLKTKGLLKQ